MSLFSVTVLLLALLAALLGPSIASADSTSSDSAADSGLSSPDRWLNIRNLPALSQTPEPLYPSSSIYNTSIPPPSGLVITPFFDGELNGGSSLWVGRVQHSVISLRPAWIQAQGIDGIMSPKNCRGIIADAEKFAASRADPNNPSRATGWLTDRHPNHATTDLPVASIYGDDRVHRYFNDNLLPFYTQIYGVDHRDLYIADLFIVKYNGDSENGQSQLESHRDRSPFSFVMSLNDDFEGGGTFFPLLDQVWRTKAGSAVLFHGQSLHGGAKVTKGVRYIIAGFVEYNDEYDRPDRYLGENKYKAFMKNYLPETDGNAAKFGFRSGDIIRGIEACYLDEEDPSLNVGGNSSENKTDCDASVDGTCTSKRSPVVKRKLVSLDNMPPPLWAEVAASCETLQPQADTVLVAERRERYFRSERTLDY